MKHSNDEMMVLELDETAMEAIRGGAEETVDWTTPQPYFEIREQALQDKEAAWNRGFDGATEIKVSEVFQAARDYADAQQRQNFAEENLNSIFSRRYEDAREQARQAQEREIEEAAEEAEDERLIQEAEDMLREADSYSGGGDGGTPANQDPYAGELQSFDPSLINAPVSHEPQISIEQIGPATSGGDYSSGQQNQETRLY